MDIPAISVWGDSIGKSVTYDDGLGRYVICRDNYETALKARGVTVRNYARIGCTSVAGEALMTDERLTGGVAVIEFGGNDSDIDWKAVCEAPEKAVHPAKVSIPRFKAAISDMISRARKNRMEPFLVTPVPVAAERYLDWVSRALDRDRILEYLGAAEFIYRWQERYALAVMEVASAAGVRVFDARGLFLGERDMGRLMSTDGIHPSPRGHALIRDAVIAMLP